MEIQRRRPSPTTSSSNNSDSDIADEIGYCQASSSFDDNDPSSMKVEEIDMSEPSEGTGNSDMNSNGGGCRLTANSITPATGKVNSNILHRFTQFLIDYWYYDLPPLYGPLRMFVYWSTLLVLITAMEGAGGLCFYVDYCQTMVSQYQHYEGLGFPLKHESGFFGMLLQVTGIMPTEQAFFPICVWSSYCVWYGLFLCGLGLGGKVPRIVVAISWWMMFGLKVGTYGRQVGHEQYLPGVAFIALCFSEDNYIDRWSFDSWIQSKMQHHRGFMRSSRRRQQPRIQQDTNGDPATTTALVDMDMSTSTSSASSAEDFSAATATTATTTTTRTYSHAGGAVRKLVLFQATCVLFFAGVHKLATFGFTWMDGRTIGNCISRQKGRVPDLQYLILEVTPWIIPVLGSSAVIGEISAIITLFSRKYRTVVVLSWISFHIGIMLLMHPNFVLNMIIYTLFIDWRGHYEYAKQYGLVYICFLDAHKFESSSSCRTKMKTKRKKHLPPLRNRIKNVCTNMQSFDWWTSSLQRLFRQQQPKQHCHHLDDDHDHGLMQTLLPIDSSLTDGHQRQHKLMKQRSTNYPKNRIVGAYVCTIAACLMFTTSMLRIDFFPFSSWVLYNWHPSDPGFGKYMTAHQAITSAHKCLRNPPANPTCNNLSGTNHHGLFQKYATKQTRIVMITALDDNENAAGSVTTTTTHPGKDQIPRRGTSCQPDEYRMYIDWESHSCWSMTQKKNNDTVSDTIRTLLRTGVEGVTEIFPIYQPSTGRYPLDLDAKIWTAGVWMGTRWRAVDAVAASIDEGANCFVQDGTTHIFQDFTASPSLTSPASRMAQRFKTKLSGSKYINHGEQVVGIGIFYEFLDDTSKNGGYRLGACNVGESFVGDEAFVPMDVYGQQEWKSRPGNWHDVLVGIVIVSMILLVMTCSFCK